MIRRMVDFLAHSARLLHVRFVRFVAHVRQSTPWAVVALGTIATVHVGCTPADVFTPRTSSDIAGAPTAGAAATTAPTTAVDANLKPITAEQGISLVANAWLLFVNEYVEPIPHGLLLKAAWRGFEAAAPGPKGAAPEILGLDAQSDIDSFEVAYLEASHGVPGASPVHSAAAYAAIRGMVKEIGDCHTGFSTPAQVAEANQRQDGVVRFAGIGVRIKRKKGEPAFVSELIAGGSAGKAGLKPGDALTAVDGVDITDLALDDIAARIRGKEGSSVKITLQRPGEKVPKVVSVSRVAITENSVESRFVGGDRVAYVRMNGFSTAAQDQAMAAIGSMQSKATKGVVLDLRTNGGGDLNVYLSFLSKFLKDGPFGFETSRKGDRIALGPDGSYVGLKVPLVVLVSDSTASAAEAFSAAVKQYGVAKVVGSQTAGCVGIGSRYGLQDGSAVAVTTRKLSGPKGEELNRVGLAPDEAVEVSREDLASGKDPVLERAVKLLGA
jgi:carboxyl-terminal processing protease